MKTIISLVVGLTFGTFNAEDPKCKSEDVVLIRGQQRYIHKNVEVNDKQEDFVMFTENGVSHIERAPYEVICNK